MPFEHNETWQKIESVDGPVDFWYIVTLNRTFYQNYPKECAYYKYEKGQ